MAMIDLYDAKANLSELVDRAAHGEEIIIAKAGRPLARLVPLATQNEPRPLGLFRGQAQIGDAFDAPLPDAVAAAFRGE